MADTVLTFTPLPSRRLLAAAIGLHLLAGAAVWWADLGWAFRLPLLAIVAASLAVSVRRPAEVALRCQGDGSLAIRKDGDWEAVTLLPDTVVLPWLVLLSYRRAGQWRPASLAILADSLAAEDFRRLRVWLKWRATVAAEDGAACMLPLPGKPSNMASTHPGDSTKP